jgi:hypothetical protein
MLIFFAMGITLYLFPGFFFSKAYFIYFIIQSAFMALLCEYILLKVKKTLKKDENMKLAEKNPSFRRNDVDKWTRETLYPGN